MAGSAFFMDLLFHPYTLLVKNQLLCYLNIRHSDPEDGSYWHQWHLMGRDAVYGGLGSIGFRLF
jgi:hypothetical protein